MIGAHPMIYLNLQALRAFDTHSAKLMDGLPSDSPLSPAANMAKSSIKYLLRFVESCEGNSIITLCACNKPLLPINVVIGDIPQVRHNAWCTRTEI